MCAATAARRDERWCGRGRGRAAGVFSHESELDLSLMVADFLENGCSGTGGSSGPDSWCSSDSDSGVADLPFLAGRISRYKLGLAPHESELRSAVLSCLMKTEKLDHLTAKCCGSCLRFGLVEMLRRSGFDAGVCSSRWLGRGKVPGGDHEYIDVTNVPGEGEERVIIDVDFRSHFEIARAVIAYRRILKSLPVVFVGSASRLKLYLEAMAEAARSSLRQNSMPIPPWRSLAYLQAKWNSPFRRLESPAELSFLVGEDHELCNGMLKRLRFSLHSEREEDGSPTHSEAVMSPILKRKQTIFAAF